MSVESALRRARARLGSQVEARTFQARDIATQLHESAPRGGTNRNAYGQPRSAPGEQPAPEHGGLMDAILNETTIDAASLTGRTTVNYAVLEFGYEVGTRSRLADKQTLGMRRMEPRPMGRMTVDQLKQEAQRGT